MDYGTAPGSLTGNAANAALVTAHSVTLTGLAPGTTYYYRVTSADAETNSATEPQPARGPAYVRHADPALRDGRYVRRIRRGIECGNLRGEGRRR